MEKLILTCGRFTPPVGEGTEARVRAMESYLSRLAEEMEFLIAELGRTVANTSVATETGEEG